MRNDFFAEPPKTPIGIAGDPFLLFWFFLQKRNYMLVQGRRCALIFFKSCQKHDFIVAWVYASLKLEKFCAHNFDTNHIEIHWFWCVHFCVAIGVSTGPFQISKFRIGNFAAIGVNMDFYHIFNCIVCVAISVRVAIFKMFKVSSGKKRDDPLDNPLILQFAFLCCD